MNTLFAKLAVSASATILSVAAAQAQDSHTMRIQTLWQPGTANQAAFERFAQDVEERTDGTVKIQAFSSGAIVGTNEMLDAVGRGLLDGMHSAVSYWTGYEPAFAALGDLTAAYNTPEQGAAYFYEHGGLELLREAYEPFGVYPVGVVWWGVESIPTAAEITDIQGLEGVKIRLPQGMSSDIFSELGAVPINLPGSEVFSAIDNGTIDATDWGTLSMNAELGFHDVVKYAIYPGIHSMPVGDVTISLDAWNALSSDQQAALEEAVRAFNEDMVDSLDALDVEAAEGLEEEGVTLVAWDDEARAALRDVARGVWEEYADKSELSRRVIDSQIEYLRSQGIID